MTNGEALAEFQNHLQRIAAARAAGSDLDTRNALLDAFAAFGPIVTETVSSRSYSTAETLLNQWSEALEGAKADLLDRQLLFSHSRLQASRGTFEETKGLEAYFLYGDFVDAPRILEKAEVHHDRSAEYASKVEFPADAPPQAKAMKDNVVGIQQAETQRVRGMRLLVQGEFESEAGALDRADSLLEQSLVAMRAGESSPPSPDAVANVLESGVRGLNMIDFAEALLHKTRSDAALLAGNLAVAATEQQARADALKRCQTMHIRAGQPLNEGFARRLARDVHVAQQRHDRLVAEAAKRPRHEWVKAIAFFVMAVGSVVLMLWLSQGELIKNKAVLALLLFFIMAIAGIGARLVEWKEAASMFRGSSG